MGRSCIAAASYGGTHPLCLLFLPVCVDARILPHYHYPENNSGGVFKVGKYRVSSESPPETKHQLREYLCKIAMELGLISPSEICSKLSVSGVVGSGWHRNDLPLRSSVLLNSGHGVRS